jgi:hypothetical protein
MTINSASWWANKLGNQQPQQPQRYGIAIERQQPQPVNQPAPVYQQQVAPVVPGERQNVLDPNRAPHEEVSMGEAMRLWRGGEAHRTEGHLACPACGSATGYTAYSGMAAGAARVNGQQPRPHCFECGYNGSFSQGLESNWA